MSVALTYGCSFVGVGLAMRFKWFEGRASVVRVVDYLHYPEEKALYLLRFVGICFALYSRGQLVKFLGFTLLATLQVWCQEVLCATQKVRKMAQFPNAFFEGGIYFACPLGLALLGDGLRRNFAFVLLLLSFSLARGWPRHSSQYLSQRDVGTSVAPRIVQLVFVLFYPRNRDCARLAADMIKIKFFSVLLYMTGLLLLQRSFVLVAGKRPSVLLDIFFLFFRAAEPVIGAVGLSAPATRLLGYC